MTTSEKIIKKRTIISCVENTLDELDWCYKTTIEELKNWNDIVDANNGEVTDYQSEEKIRIDTRIEFYNKLIKYLEDFI